jgi:hypothetical protein
MSILRLPHSGRQTPPEKPENTRSQFELGVIELVREGVRLELGDFKPSNDTSPRLLDRKKLAMVFGVSIGLIDRMRDKGMPYVMLGDCPRFELEKVLEWLRNGGAR